MIRFRSDIISQLKAAGFSSYFIRKNRIISESALTMLRRGDPSIVTVDRVCALLQCQPGDILEYIPDPPSPGEK